MSALLVIAGRARRRASTDQDQGPGRGGAGDVVTPATTGPEAMRGRRARVETSDGRRHAVKVDDKLWTAICRDALAPGDHVVIVDVEGLTLRVRRDD